MAEQQQPSLRVPAEASSRPLSAAARQFFSLQNVNTQGTRRRNSSNSTGSRPAPPRPLISQQGYVPASRGHAWGVGRGRGGRGGYRANGRPSGTGSNSSRPRQLQLIAVSAQRVGIENVPLTRLPVPTAQFSPGRNGRKVWNVRWQHEKELLAYLASQGLSAKPVPEPVRRYAMSLSTTPAAAAVDLDDSCVPRKLATALHPFQREGVAFAIRHGSRVIIGDEMGLGKTLQGIAVACYHRELWPALVIVPSSLRYVWRDALQEWVPDLPLHRIRVVMTGKDPDDDCDVCIISYDLATKRAAALAPSSARFRVVVCDESHFLKTRTTKRCKAILPLLRAADVAVLLTGSPAMSRPVELFTQVHLLRPKLFPSYQYYIQRYCNPRHTSFGVDVTGHDNLSELHFLLTSGIMIRRLKADVLTQLPAKRRQVITLQLEPAVRARLIEDRERLEAMLAASDRSPMMEWYHTTSQAKAPAVTKYLEDILDQDIKMLVFAHHKSMLDAIEACCRKRVKYIRIDGSTPHAKRPELVQLFQQDESVKVAVLSIGAAGTGLTLTAASTVVFAELTWTPGDLAQAEDRAHRIGQRSSVHVIYLLADGSVDLTMWKMNQRKQAVVSDMVGNSERRLATIDDDDGQGNQRGSTGALKPLNLVSQAPLLLPGQQTLSFQPVVAAAVGGTGGAGGTSGDTSAPRTPKRPRTAPRDDDADEAHASAATPTASAAAASRGNNDNGDGDDDIVWLGTSSGSGPCATKRLRTIASNSLV